MTWPRADERRDGGGHLAAQGHHLGDVDPEDASARHHQRVVGLRPSTAVVGLERHVEHGGVGADAAAPIVMRVIDHYLGSRAESPQPRREGGVPPPLPGQRAREAADLAPNPDRAIALTGAKLPGERPLAPPPQAQETGPSGQAKKERRP